MNQDGTCTGREGELFAGVGGGVGEEMGSPVPRLLPGRNVGSIVTSAVLVWPDRTSGHRAAGLNGQVERFNRTIGQRPIDSVQNVCESYSGAPRPSADEHGPHGSFSPSDSSQGTVGTC